MAQGVRLVDEYDVAMLDLDGVVYIGGAAVAGAPGAITAARAEGMRVSFITNNASRPTSATADHLRALGIPASAEDVVSSAQAASQVLRERFGAGAPIAVLGAEGLTRALEDVGLAPTRVDGDAVALVSGYGPDTPWRDIMRAATRVRDGLPWVACNTDATIPADYGVAPGHGVLVDLISRFSAVEPTVAGKPARPLLEETIRRTGARHPLMVGDRLDTDIAGAVNVGIDSLLVMTGVTGVRELVAAAPGERPTYVAGDLTGLLSPIAPVTTSGPRADVGGWTAAVDDDGVLAIEGRGSADAWWSALAAVAWWCLDATGSTADTSRVVAPEKVASSA